MKQTTRLFLKYMIFAFLVGIFSITTFAVEYPEIKERVNDYVGVFKPSEKEYLTSILKATEDKTSCQVVLVVVESLEGIPLEEYSLRTAEKAKLGQKNLDNGVLVLVAMAEKKIRIEVGYGLEPLLTDVKSGYIIRKLIVPEFEKGKYFNGLHSGLQAITGIISKDYDISPEELAKFKKEQKKTRGPHISMGLIVFLLIFGLSIFKNSTRSGGGGGGSVATAIILGSMMSGGSHSHRGGGFGGGGGGFSGGGGSFGGGGSSGGW